MTEASAARCVRRCRRGGRAAPDGQILLPSLLILPALFLFVFLIFDAAKLSREKIRHQFAVDAAAFVEMTNYSDFFNRTAYINGAFPERIFKEAFLAGNSTCFASKHTNQNNGACSGGKQAYTVLYENGDFPGKDPPHNDTDLDASGKWDIEYSPADPRAAEKQVWDPENGFAYTSCKALSSGAEYSCLDVFSRQNALDYWVDWETAHHIFDLYVMVYQLLGSVEEAQQKVFSRLVTGHQFYVKSWWLNTGDSNAQAEAATTFSPPFIPDSDPKPQCIKELMFYGNQPKPDPYQPYIIYAPKQPVTGFTTGSAGTGFCSKGPAGDGLFQVESVDEGHLMFFRQPHEAGGWPGLPVMQEWTAPDNYFKVPMNAVPGNGCGGSGPPCVHATISTGYSPDPGIVAPRVWPDPTPKFQTELFP